MRSRPTALPQSLRRTALGSARETNACLDVAIALGYLDDVDVLLRKKLDVVIGGLVRLTV